ncbi:heparinase II/III domain-containing protein [Aquimarina pacifica]|uniref:heparinase II/III domain-containing protein n=1 Tax=Aquimarina pacifica TaxID=1296415 RepID=UPI000471367F|nr:heparinase II/III family protein [Aquimarina pacifica]
MTYKSNYTIRLRLGSLLLALVLSITSFNCKRNQEQEPTEETITTSKYPILGLSSADAKEIRTLIGSDKILQASYVASQETADQAITNGIEVPLPKDPGGGYTHEKHKRNYHEMYSAGLSYQITNDKKYAQFVIDMLLQYAAMYPKLPLHPKSKENHPAGKLFWQGLNESVWLVNTIQAYDLIYDTVNDEDRKIIEDQLFRNVVEFVSVDSKDTFNRIHNHGTWAVAGVGMTGYVLDDQDMVDRALYGSNKDKETGFLKQIDMLFSPDGYYSEGPYYQRYAMMPFMVFAQAIQNNQPDLKIFEHRNQLLGKAVTTVLQLTDENGAFLPFNDALKEKNYLTGEMVFASNIAYAYYKDSALLPVILKHQQVSISSAGLQVIKGLENYTDTGYVKNSMLIKDGNGGQDGGLALFRMPNEKDGKLNAIFKFASQGMGHGHFDRLSLFMYNGKQEILQDYGAARFLNVESKVGGRYLPENQTWAKQTIAHNTVTIDEKSQFGANVKKSSTISPKLVFSHLENENVQVVSAIENNGYEGVEMQRTIAMVKDEKSERPPFIVDVYNLRSDKSHQYDLNFMYQGHVMETNFEYVQQNPLKALGTNNGYQHLWKLAEGTSDNTIATLTWLNKNTFYSISSLINSGSKMIFSKLGANDPNFNLRNDPSYMIREKGKSNHTFVNVIEPHGDFDPKLESVKKPHSDIKDIQLIVANKEYTIVQIIFKSSQEYTLMLSNQSHDSNKTHKITIEEKEYQWTGNYNLKLN